MAASRSLVPLVLGAAIFSAGARAEETTAPAEERVPRAGLATGLGAGLALTSLAVGGTLFASSDDDGLHRGAIYVMMVGLTVAPALSHLVVREYKRAALFSILPACALIANAVVMSVDPEVTTNGSPATRSVFGIAITAGVIGAVVGLADTLGARDRFFARHPYLQGRF
jgi:hypothetical protein